MQLTGCRVACTDGKRPRVPRGFHGVSASGSQAGRSQILQVSVVDDPRCLISLGSHLVIHESSSLSIDIRSADDETANYNV
jgi:hypothetical protein